MTSSSLGSEKRSIPKPGYIAAALLPYAAVAIGLYLLENAWAAMLGYLAGMALILATLCLPLPHDKPSPRGKSRFLGPGLLAASLLSGPSILLLWPWAKRSGGSGLAAFLSSHGLTQEAWPFFAAVLCLATPLLEEGYWRVWLGRAGIPPIWTQAWFAGYHLVVLAPLLHPAWLLVVFVSLAAAGWGWQHLLGFRYGLRWSIICHAVADLSVMLAASQLLGLFD